MGGEPGNMDSLVNPESTMKRTRPPSSRRPAIEPTKDLAKPPRPAFSELPMDSLEFELAMIRIRIALLQIRAR
jgi:hypothetical protein